MLGRTALLSRRSVAMRRRFTTGAEVPKAIHKLGKLNHVAVAVPDLEAARSFYQNVLGGKVTPSEELPDHGVTVSFVELGNTKIELLYPLGESSPIQNFLKKNTRGGVHHYCIEVENVAASVAALAEHGIKPLGPAKIGSHGKLVVFLNPKDCCGVLVELEEETYPEE